MCRGHAVETMDFHDGELGKRSTVVLFSTRLSHKTTRGSQ